MGARNPLKALRRRMAVILWAEALFLAAAPAALLLLAYVCLALFGCGGADMFLACAALAILALGHGLAKIRPPGPANIDRRIERASGLRHRPFAAADDVPASAGAAGAVLWEAHQRRLALALLAARSGGPELRLAARDPYALRGFLLLLLLAGIVFAGPAAPARLAAAFVLPPWPFAGPSVNAWITPPPYDPAPPLLLTAGQNVTALTGSRITLIVNGPSRAPAIRLGATMFADSVLSETSHRADAVLRSSGRLLIGPWWHRIGAWNIAVIAPSAPSISLTELTRLDDRHLRLGWQAADQYGLAKIALALTPPGYPDALPETFALGPEAHSARIDVGDSPFAGLKMMASLSAKNLAGMSAAAPARQFTLPAFPWHDKTALALAATRQFLALHPGTLTAAGAAVGKIAAFPPSLISFSADLKLAALGSAMAAHGIGAQEAVDRLGALIAEIDAGPDFAPGRALAQANQALLRALQQGLNGKPASAGDLQKLLQSMQNALARHLAAVDPHAEQAQGGARLDISQLDQMAQKIAADEAAGKTAQAAAELRQLQAVLNALRSATPMTAAQAARAQAADQAAQALAQLTTGEAGLLDDTHRGSATPGEQGTLSNALSTIQQSLRQAGISLPGLAGAGAAMGAAQSALAKPDSGQAESAESTAIQNLQQAAAALAASTPESFAFGQGSGQMPDEDPAGESTNGAPDEASDPSLGLPTSNPAEAIQQQIMKEDSNPSLPAAAHQYLGRLLNPDQ